MKGEAARGGGRGNGDEPVWKRRAAAASGRGGPEAVRSVAVERRQREEEGSGWASGGGDGGSGRGRWKGLWKGQRKGAEERAVGVGTGRKGCNQRSWRMPCPLCASSE